jgi:hypothetical protein
MVPQAYRLRAIMKQGTAASIPETWTHYPSAEDARAGAKLMYHNDRVLRARDDGDRQCRLVCRMDRAMTAVAHSRHEAINDNDGPSQT